MLISPAETKLAKTQHTKVKQYSLLLFKCKHYCQTVSGLVNDSG